jgi:hypothetical protein
VPLVVLLLLLSVLLVPVLLHAWLEWLGFISCHGTATRRPI